MVLRLYRFQGGAQAIFTLRAAIIGALIGLGTLGNVGPASAAVNPHADPVIGPNTREEVLHRQDSPHFTPAQTPLKARQARPALSAANGAAVTATSLTGPLKKEVFGFAPYYHLANHATWNYSLVSTIAYFGIGINADGSLNTSEQGWAGWNSQELVDIINAAHAAGNRAVVTIRPIRDGAPGHTTAWTVNQIVADPAHTQAAITSTINAMAAKSVNGVPTIDGVNVDFEGSADGYPAVQSGFTNFVGQLGQQLKARWPTSMVTADTYTGSAGWDGGIFNISQLAPLVDGLFVMTYDESFSNMPNQAGPNAPLAGFTYNDSLAVAQYTSKAPPGKVILGMPYYGYKWSTVNNGLFAPIASTTTGVDGYADLAGDFACAPLLSQHWDLLSQTPWVAWWSPKINDPCGGNHGSWREMYYDDATSLGIKYDLVNNSGLMGTGMWELGFQGGSQDLWQVIADKFETTWPGQYRPLTPARVLDTRTSIGGHPAPLAGGQSIDVTVAGGGGVPPGGAAAVVLNATVVNPTSPSHLIVYPSGAGRPQSSTLNFGPGQTVANLVEVALGANGKVSVYNDAGSANVILDVEGWVMTGAATGTMGRFQALTPSRLLDTRTGFGGSSALGAGGSFNLPVLNNGGVPAAGVSAVVLNLTVTGPSSAGYVSAYPTGVARPNASNVNYVPGATVANRVVVPVGAGGKVTLFNCCGRTDLVVDVTGFFTDASSTLSGGQLSAISPVRIVDTRLGFGLAGPLGPGATASAPIAGQATVPAGATAIAINITATNPTAAGYLTVFPDGSARPATSDLNITAGKSAANFVLARLGTDGNLAVYNAGGTTDVIIDVVGWYK